MDIGDLDEFLKWRKIKSRRATDLGAYSQGGKSAIGYLGRSIIVTASPLGKNTSYRLEDDNLHDYKLKEYRITEFPTENIEGFVKIEIGDIKRKIKEGELKEILKDTYRPLLQNNDV